VTAVYLFNEKALKAFGRYVGPDTLFAFDLDGTLAPIVAEYSAARVAEPVRCAMERLVKLAKVSVITGRSRKDALAILGFEPHLLVGNHGAEWPVGTESRDQRFVQTCTGWREQLREGLKEVRGIEIEFKGESLSVHYRKATDPEKTLAYVNAAIEQLTPEPKRIGGKFVVNLLPMEAQTKGEALVASMERLGLTRSIFFGDDLTDEEVFQLKDTDLFGIHIGKDDRTAAPYYLNSQSELLGLLNSIVGMLESLSIDRGE